MANVKDVSLLDPDELKRLTLPSADERGIAAGAIPPAQKDYTRMNYKVVSLEEAEKLMHMRTTGKLDAIGLDAMGKTKPAKVVKGKKMEKSGSHMVTKTRHSKSTAAPADYDPLGDKEPEPGDPSLEAEERQLAAQQELNDRGNARPERTSAVSAPVVTAKDIYLEKRTKVAMELQDGTMFISVIDIKEGPHSVTLILPAAVEGGSTFIPKAGTELNVSGNSKSWHCFFPGTWFSIDELGIIGLVFVKAD